MAVALETQLLSPSKPGTFGSDWPSYLGPRITSVDNSYRKSRDMILLEQVLDEAVQPWAAVEWADASSGPIFDTGGAGRCDGHRSTN